MEVIFDVLGLILGRRKRDVGGGLSFVGSWGRRLWPKGRKRPRKEARPQPKADRTTLSLLSNCLLI